MHRWTFRSPSQTRDRQSAEAQCALVRNEPAPFLLRCKCVQSTSENCHRHEHSVDWNTPDAGQSANWHPVRRKG